MHFITTLKSSGEIVDYRVDNSVPQYWTTDTLKSAVSTSRNLAEETLETYSFAELPEVAHGFSIVSLTPHVHSYDVATGKLKDNPTYVAPAIVKKYSLDDIVANLSLAEKTKFNNRSTPTVVTAISEMRTLREETDTREILQFLVDSGDISQASMDKILG